MGKTEISWTEFTWNPVTGCDKISAGCKNCYAESIANRFWKDRKFTDIEYHLDRIFTPQKIKKPSMIFVNSMSDLFHEKLSTQMIFQIYQSMKESPQHIFQVLTKRPENMLRFLRESVKSTLSNVWYGVSAENQKYADERIPLLLQTPAKIRWVSIEPMLGPIDLNKKELLIDKTRFKLTIGNYLDWVVVGCESGPKKRECKIEWIESIVEQCKAANVPVFVKQIQINGKVEKDINNFPDHLKIQEYPNYEYLTK